jgi:hypothetical protein
MELPRVKFARPPCLYYWFRKLKVSRVAYLDKFGESQSYDTKVQIGTHIHTHRRVDLIKLPPPFSGGGGGVESKPYNTWNSNSWLLPQPVPCCIISYKVLLQYPFFISGDARFAASGKLQDRLLQHDCRQARGVLLWGWRHGHQQPHHS